MATDNPTKAKPETVHTSGGSTNAVLHLIAMAKACGLKLTVDDFQVSLSLSLSLSLILSLTHTHTWHGLQRVSDKIPFLADTKP